MNYFLIAYGNGIIAHELIKVQQAVYVVFVGFRGKEIAAVQQKDVPFTYGGSDLVYEPGSFCKSAPRNVRTVAGAEDSVSRI